MVRLIALSMLVVMTFVPAAHAEAPPVFILEWGTFGPGNGQFLQPHGIAINSLGQLYVADSNNHRLQKFDNTGAFLLVIGGAGSADGQFLNPHGVDIGLGDVIYVADLSNDRIQKLDAKGTFFLKWGSTGSGNGQFQGPHDVAVDAAGFVYVADLSNHRIQKFTSNGTYMLQFGSFGSNNGEFNSPYSIAVDANADIYVADSQNARVQKFDSAGTYLAQWGTFGSGDGQFNNPSAIDADSNGDVFVADYGSDRVQKFDNAGVFLSKWGSSGSGEGQFATTFGLVASGLDVFVTDRDNTRVQKFTYDRDLAITALVSPAESRTQCDAVAITVTVENIGSMDSEGFDVTVRMASDSMITTSDFLLSTISVPAGLTAFSDTTVALSLSLPFDAPRGNLYIGAIADDANAVVEVNESNNIAFNALAYHVPLMQFVTDLPGDQGGEVYVAWWGSPLDSPAEGGLITQYTIWRAITEADAAALIENGGAKIVNDGEALVPVAGQQLIRASASTCAPYFWQFIDIATPWYIPTYGQLEPTLFDSTSVSPQYQYFQVIAHTSEPLTFYTSNPDSGRSVDNIGPMTPVNLAADQEFTAEGVTLAWDPNVEPDLDHYALYKSTDPNFMPGPGNLASAVTGETYFDSEWRWYNQFYYKLSAVDAHENESGFASVGPDDVTAVANDGVPSKNFLGQNWPNPFNPATTIRFGLSQPGHVSLKVYDAGGGLVRALVEERRGAGPFSVEWDGTNDARQPVASGVYFYRLRTEGFVQTRKMVMVR